MPINVTGFGWGENRFEIGNQLCPNRNRSRKLTERE